MVQELLQIKQHSKMGLVSISNILLLSFVLVILDCNNSQVKPDELKQESAVLLNMNNNKYEKGIKNYDYVVSFDWEGGFEDKNIKFNLLKSEYAAYISDYHFVWEGNINGIGNIQAYKIKLNGKQSGMYRGDKILLINKASRKGYILWIDSFEPLQLRNKEDSFFVAGRENFKQYGNFYIYHMQQDTLFKVFESDKLVTNNRLDECKRYKGGNLKLRTVDIDSNGFNDIIFEGVEYSFCDGLSDEILEEATDSLNVIIIYKTILQKDNYLFIRQ